MGILSSLTADSLIGFSPPDTSGNVSPVGGVSPPMNAPSAAADTAQGGGGTMTRAGQQEASASGGMNQGTASSGPSNASAAGNPVSQTANAGGPMPHADSGTPSPKGLASSIGKNLTEHAAHAVDSGVGIANSIAGGASMYSSLFGSGSMANSSPMQSGSVQGLQQAAPMQAPSLAPRPQPIMGMQQAPSPMQMPQLRAPEIPQLSAVSDRRAKTNIKADINMTLDDFLQSVYQSMKSKGKK